jgi:phytoene desaturase
VELGGELRLSTRWPRSGRRALAPCDRVRLEDGSRVRADAVVSNADVAWTYMKLVDPRFRPSDSDARLKRLRYSMSLFVLYFGTDRKYEDIAHHEILMGPRYKQLLDDIFTRKTLSDDFSLYLHRPTATDPSLAPPAATPGTCSRRCRTSAGTPTGAPPRSPYRDRIVNYLEERYLPGLSKHIVTEHYIDPLHFADTLNSHVGSAFSVEPILTQSAWFRPHNRSKDVANLYFAGAGTHPGAGLPGVMSSGRSSPT